MKRRNVLLFFSIIFISTFLGISFIGAQDFDSISHPPDFSVRQNEYSIITWEVSISSVTTPTYDVYINGISYIPNYIWELEGTTGTISINVNTTKNPGLYNYTIVVKDGAGHEISDEVMVTILEKSGWENFWSSRLGYIVFGVLAVAGFLVVVYFVRKKGMEKSQSLIPR